MLVRFVPHATPAQRAELLASVGGVAERHFHRPRDLTRVRLFGQNPLAVVAALRQSAIVRYAEPNYLQFLADPQFEVQYALKNEGQVIPPDTGQWFGVEDADINAEAAWAVTTGSSSVIIAVIDSGFTFEHEDFGGQITPSYTGSVWVNWAEFLGNPNVDDDNNGYMNDYFGWNFGENHNDISVAPLHGTPVAGIIAALHNSVGIKGVAPGCKVMLLAYQNTLGETTVCMTIEAIQYAVDKGASVINYSSAGTAYSQALYDAVAAAEEAGGVIFVAAAGNAGVNCNTTPFYPACFDLSNVIGVAGTNNLDLLGDFGGTQSSNYGTQTIHVAAPGWMIRSLDEHGSYDYFGGTSYAAPHVAGVVGLIRSRYPNWTVAQVRQRLFDSVRTPLNQQQSLPVIYNGVIDAGAAVE